MNDREQTKDQLSDESMDEDQLQVGIEKFADSSINIGIRYWVPTNKYFETQYAVNLSIYKNFKAANISIPYPQRDVHVVTNTG